jgi:hypothetical protein
MPTWWRDKNQLYAIGFRSCGGRNSAISCSKSIESGTTSPLSEASDGERCGLIVGSLARRADRFGFALHPPIALATARMGFM